MKLQTFDIPDDPATLPDWLDQQMLSLHLHQLVMELAILGGLDQEPAVPLKELLGEQIRGVLQTGLRCLSRDQLRQLLKMPQSLLELQRLVLDEGGDYWTTVPLSPALQDNSRKTWQSVEKVIHETEPKSVPLSVLSAVRRPWFWAGAGWLSAAAAVFFAFFVQENRVQQLEKSLAERTRVNDSLRKELQAQQVVAVARVQPADLPDQGEYLVHATTDPVDLPEDDPPDLPETSHPRLDVP